jgi:hypothetical protein
VITVEMRWFWNVREWFMAGVAGRGTRTFKDFVFEKKRFRSKSSRQNTTLIKTAKGDLKTNAPAHRCLITVKSVHCHRQKKDSSRNPFFSKTRVVQ